VISGKGQTSDELIGRHSLTIGGPGPGSERPRSGPTPLVGQGSCRRSVPVTTMSTCRPPHPEQTSRSRHSGTVVWTPYRSAISAASGSTRWPHALHHAISLRGPPRRCLAVIGGPGGDFMSLRFDTRDRHLAANSMLKLCGTRPWWKAPREPPYRVRRPCLDRRLGSRSSGVLEASGRKRRIAAENPREFRRCISAASSLDIDATASQSTRAGVDRPPEHRTRRATRCIDRLKVPPRAAAGAVALVNSMRRLEMGEPHLAVPRSAQADR